MRLILFHFGDVDETAVPGVVVQGDVAGLVATRHTSAGQRQNLA